MMTLQGKLRLQLFLLLVYYAHSAAVQLYCELTLRNGSYAFSFHCFLFFFRGKKIVWQAHHQSYCKTKNLKLEIIG